MTKSLFVLSIFISKMVVGGSWQLNLEEQKAIRAMEARVETLNHCKKTEDCLATNRNKVWCPPPAFCGGCGIVIQKNMLEEFEALASKSQNMKHPHCGFNDFCGGVGCVLMCVAGKCQGKYEEHPVY